MRDTYSIGHTADLVGHEVSDHGGHKYGDERYPATDQSCQGLAFTAFEQQGAGADT